MYEPVNELGNRYSKWLVIKDVGENKYRQTLWKVRCVCGSKSIILGVDLRTGTYKACNKCKPKSSSEQHLIDNCLKHLDSTSSK